MTSTLAATKSREQMESDSEKKKLASRDPAREVVETIVFVVVLVLLLKLFVTEAFVIPTGSMAETLYGYQKLITCTKCGHLFPINSHDEVEVNQSTRQRHPLVGYTCPNCRYMHRDLNHGLPEKNNSGDRVLVLKPLYHIRPPHRGDVVVFKYPEAPQENHVPANYIKRAMGFGGETIAIHRGDLFMTRSLAYPEDNPLFPRPERAVDLWKPEYRYPNSAHAEELFRASREAGFTNQVPGGFEIIRKGEQQLLADMRMVWDNDKQPKELVGIGLPRWQIVGPEGRWTTDNDKQPRAFAHSGDELDWITYKHLVWKLDANKRRVPWRWPDPEGAKPVPGPIDNMLGYNAGIEWNPVLRQAQSRDESRDSLRDATMWVGDLILECEVEMTAGSEVVLELTRSTSRFQAKFGNGQVSLARIGALGPEFGQPTRPYPVQAGTYKLRFANVDCRLWVWVDGKLIDFGDEANYSPVEPATLHPDDLQNKEGYTQDDIDRPASIGARGAVASIRHIKLYRDIYYTRELGVGDHSSADIFYVQPGHYLCLGDNSAQSSDSRKWGVVPERLLLGKAVFVFFPLGRVGFIK